MSVVVSLSDLIVVNFEGRSTVPEKRTLRALSYQMFPQFVFDTYPTFVEFAETFMDFIEKRYSPDGMPSPGPYHILKNLLDTSDIDSTELEFVKFLKIKLGRDLPASTAYDLRTFLKHIKDFYLSKGTENSIQFFFRSVFNTFSRIYLPKNDLVRASYNTWYVPYVTTLQRFGGAQLGSGDLETLFDAYAVGHSSKATAWLGRPLAGDVIEILASSGQFTPGETVSVTKTDGVIEDFWIPLNGLSFLPGSFLTDDGMPSSTKRLQDSFYWQDFSYEVISPNQVSDIINPLVMNVHPAGFKIFAKVTEENPGIIDPSDDETEIELIRSLLISVIQFFDEDSEEIELIQFPLNYSFMSFVQSFTDVGEMAEDENELSFSLVYQNQFSLDGQQIASLEKDEPQFNLFVSFGGLKMPSGNESVYGHRDDGARVFSSSNQTVDIGFGGFSIETLEDVTIEKASKAYCRNLARRDVKSEILTLSDRTLLNVSPIFTLYGTAPVEAGWTNTGTTGKVALVFLNGMLIKSPLVTVSTEVVEGVRVAKLLFTGADEIIFRKPLIEIVYLSDRDMSGVADGDNRTSISITSRVGQTRISWSGLPTESESLLLFKNGLNLVYPTDFKIDASSGENSLYLKEPVSLGDVLDMYVLRNEVSNVTSLTPLIGPDETYRLNRPVDAPLEIIPTKLETAIANCLVWWSFEEDSYDYTSQYFNPVWGTAGFAGCDAYLSSSRFSKLGPFDSIKTMELSSTLSEISLTASFSLSSFIPVADDPFSINVWIKFSDVATDQVVYYFGQSQTTDALLDKCSAHLKVVKTGSDFRLVARSSDDTTLTTIQTSLGSVIPDTWYMVSLRFNGTDTLFLDVKGESTSISLTAAMTGVVTADNGNDANIGSDGTLYDFIGQIAHLGLWNTFLRDHEISALYTNRLSKPVYYI